MSALARFARSRVAHGPWPVVRSPLWAIALASVVLAACASAPQAEKKETTMPKLERAPVLLPVAADPTVSFAVAFDAGSRDDPAGKEGLAFLTATLMAEGATSRHPYAEILELLYPMAASYAVRVDKERTTFTGRVHRDNLDAYIELLLDAVVRPAFTAADFERIRQRTVDAIEKTLRYASDEELGKAALHNAVFAGTPYGHIPAGTVAGLKAITLDDVRAFYDSRFTREALTFGVGGGFPPDLPGALSAGLSELPSAPPAARPVPRPQLAPGRQAVIVSKPGPATAISFGFPLAARRGEREFYALWLANSWLGEHRNSASHLYQVIREARGMNYGDYSYIEWFPEGGMRQMPPPGAPRRAQLFEVWIRPVPNAQAHFALRAAMRELERLVADGLTEEQFQLTRQFLSKYCLHFAETTASRLGYALDDRFYGIAPDGHLARFGAMMASLTRDEVNAAIAKHLRPDTMVIAMVSAEADKLAAALAGEAPSPITYDTPKPPEVLAEDAEIEAYPLRVAKDAIRVLPVERMFAE